MHLTSAGLWSKEPAFQPLQVKASHLFGLEIFCPNQQCPPREGSSPAHPQHHPLPRESVQVNGQSWRDGEIRRIRRQHFRPLWFGDKQPHLLLSPTGESSCLEVWFEHLVGADKSNSELLLEWDSSRMPLELIVLLAQGEDSLLWEMFHLQQKSQIKRFWSDCQDSDEDWQPLQGHFLQVRHILSKPSYHQVYFHMDYKLIEIIYGKILLMFSEYL